MKIFNQNKLPIATTGYIGSTEPGQKAVELAAKGTIGIPQYALEVFTPKSLEKYIKNASLGNQMVLKEMNSQRKKNDS